jgi:hypothetical protein
MSVSEKNSRTITLSITGLGMIIYSPFAVSHISEGEDYLAAHYWDADAMLEHVHQGTLIGFGTGSPGTFVLKVLQDYPEESMRAEYDLQLTLGIEVRDRRVYIRDLYDLLKWTAACPAEQSLEMDSGWHQITLLSKVPASGVVGDNQIILVHFKKTSDQPAVSFTDIPQLFAAT